MRILSINLGNYSSTGSIAQGIKNKALEHDIEYVLAYPYDPMNKRCENDDWVIGTKFGRKCSVTLGMMTGYNGCFSFFSTFRLLCKIEQYKPDIIHLHNLHNNYINLPLLFKYLKKNPVSVVWTLHDCWAFTGQCPYFDMNACEKWITGCYDCQRYREYPKAFVDRTCMMWRCKKSWFTGVGNLFIITPSEWLAKLVKKSYLKEYSVSVINNGIDLTVFRPIKRDIKYKYGLNEKKVILGVAFEWGKRKGLDVFVELSNLLPKEYRIVLVGIDKKLKESIPDSIITIERTQSKRELAEIYNMADVFVNPTREENFPTVNMEALACGTPIVTFRTGGSPEIIDEKTGIIVEREHINDMLDAVIEVCSSSWDYKGHCIKRAKTFNMEKKFLEYIELYERIELKRNSKN